MVRSLICHEPFNLTQEIFHFTHSRLDSKFIYFIFLFYFSHDGQHGTRSRKINGKDNELEYIFSVFVDI